MRYFGVEEANRLIPLLTHTFSVVRPRVERVHAIVRELEALQGTGTEPERMTSLREERDVLIEQIHTELEHFQELGVEVKAADGLVDFRALKAGRPVLLCWRYGEPEVAHWHELEGGFAGRQPIVHAHDFAPSYLS
ncbi:DUF2203 domain-containing protein [Archangium lansingense]|uniref:DUF2203 domain-containing protein n=1 Tax=Archangium lansingense TaxID=2995310 RepID=A0ABT4ALV5_9BACT|nr:DUF2203 domain-containing protein [Archangium lansinium]MCY1082679.1 DUF2203 domain-containing protein [Archangium lansinium]